MNDWTRRAFGTGLLATAACAGARLSRAEGMCPPPGFAQPGFPPVCNAFVSFARLNAAAQANTLWCWAASISMIFAYHGHEVPQQQIVQTAFGGSVNLPGQPHQIVQLLNRQWQDAQGKTFSSRIDGIFGPMFGFGGALSNADIVNALQQNRPLLYCNMSHAMMLVQVNYLPTPPVPNIQAALVVDPWPGLGVRQLNQPELYPAPMGQATLLAAVSIS